MKNQIQINNLKGKKLKKGVDKRFINTLRHFGKLQDLIENEYHDCITQFDIEFCSSKPFLIATVLKMVNSNALDIFKIN
jgi:hypothetical protein